jgi:hypothetical protein
MIVSMPPLNQGTNTDEHVLAAGVVPETDDGGARGSASTLQVEQLVGELDAPDPVSTGKRDRHDEMRLK